MDIEIPQYLIDATNAADDAAWECAEWDQYSEEEWEDVYNASVTATQEYNAALKRFGKEMYEKGRSVEWGAHKDTL